MYDLIKKARAVIIYGATASGKSAIAEQLRVDIKDALIINADSRQVYREVPIITAQPEIDSNYKLYSIISCVEQFSVATWLTEVEKVLNEAVSYGKIPLIVGGTGLYIESLLNGLTAVPTIPKSAYLLAEAQLAIEGFAQLHSELLTRDPNCKILKNDKQRLIRALAVFNHTGKSLTTWQNQAKTQSLLYQQKIVKIWVRPSRDLLYKRINARFIQLLSEGAINEVAKLKILLPKAVYPKIIGLQEILAYLSGEITESVMIEKAQQMTRNYAKRQETWFRNRLQADIELNSPEL